MVQYVTFKTTSDRKLKFGVYWIQPCTDENEVQTWLGANPFLMSNE